MDPVLLEPSLTANATFPPSVLAYCQPCIPVAFTGAVLAKKGPAAPGLNPPEAGSPLKFCAYVPAEYMMGPGVVMLFVPELAE